MITPSEARKLADSNRLLDELESLIDAALTADAADNSWPCTIDLRGNIVPDQRDGDFISLHPPVSAPDPADGAGKKGQRP